MTHATTAQQSPECSGAPLRVGVAAVAIGGALFAIALGLNILEYSPSPTTLATLWLVVTLLAAPPMLMAPRHRADVRRGAELIGVMPPAGVRWSRTLKRYALSIAAGVTLLWGVSMTITRLVHDVGGTSTGRGADVVERAAAFPAPVLAIAALGIGLSEELLFRSGVVVMLSYRGASTLLGRRIAIGAIVVLSSALFGMVHRPYGVPHVVSAVVVGFGLAGLALWSRSIWPGVIAHSFFDAYIFLQLPQWHPLLP